MQIDELWNAKYIHKPSVPVSWSGGCRCCSLTSCWIDATAACRCWLSKDAWHCIFMVTRGSQVCQSESWQFNWFGSERFKRIYLKHPSKKPWFFSYRYRYKLQVFIVTMYQSQVQGCKRGLPLYPLPSASYGVEPTVTIAAGEPLGLENWVRFSPCQAGSKQGRLIRLIRDDKLLKVTEGKKLVVSHLTTCMVI